ncbi:MAG: hypothetical protein EA412_14335 [Chitinophagaceae bacterium]|nr:MAG: hypothetical protein EA412_14335 [Chitinophagaceae bacterium]
MLHDYILILCFYIGLLLKKAQMKGENFIEELINALNPSEKRYVKLYLKRNTPESKDNNYLKLFLILEKNIDITDKEIIRQFPKKFTANQLSVTKFYLTNQILKALENFQYEKSKEQKIRSGLSHVSILFSKSMYDQSLKLCKKLHQAAIKNDLLFYQLEIKLWEAKILSKKVESKNPEAIIEKTFRDLNAISDSLNTYIKLQEIDYLILLQNQRGGLTRKPEEELKIKEWVKKVEASKTETLGSFKNEYLYHHILSLGYYQLQDTDKNFQHRKGLIELFDKYEEMKTTFADEYISTLNNFILVCGIQKKEEQFFDYLQILKSYTSNDRNLITKVLYTAYTQELLYYYNNKNYTAALELIPKIDTFLIEHEKGIPLSSKMLFMFLITGIYLGSGKKEKALEWNNRFLNYPDAEKIYDLYLYSRIFQIMIHFEMGNQILVNSLLKSIYRHLLQNERLYLFEKKLIAFLKNILKDNNKIKQYFLEMLNDIKTLKKDPYEKKAFQYFDFETWLSKKIELLN